MDVHAIARLRRHLFERHVSTLSPEEQTRIREGSHPSQSHACAEEAERYVDLLVRHLADPGYDAHVGIGFYHANRIVLTAELDHVPEMLEYAKVLPLYFRGFEVKRHGRGPEAAKSDSRGHC